MKKAAVLAGILALLIVFSQKPARAASELETWCLSAGEAWDPAYSICTVNGLASITEPLTILPGEWLDIRGNLSNTGHIHNNGYMGALTGDLYNDSVIENNGTLEIYRESEFIND